MEHTKVCLIGQVLVDVFLPAGTATPGLRLGGIMHAARALWAMQCPYVMAYVAPAYLDPAVVRFARSYGAEKAIKIGNVEGSPNVVLVGEPTEAGPQGYEFLLRDEHTCSLTPEALRALLRDDTISDVLVFPGGFDLPRTLALFSEAKAAVHIDANFEPADLAGLGDLGRSFATVILSTSSQTFQGQLGGSARALCGAVLGKYADAVLLKENRGGSRFFRHADADSPIGTPAQVRRIMHSVGVGDCFDAVYVVKCRVMPDAPALAYAANIAAEYACTTDPDEFRNAACATLSISAEEIVSLTGILLPWEERPRIQVYIAAPDFDYVDRKPIEQVVECLKYHNFTPRRPVVEHGQCAKGDSVERRQLLCDSDLELLEQCQIMLAVLPFDDPGTLIEIGVAVERRMPVIVYDPYRQAQNLMLTQLPACVSSDLDQVITAVFAQAARLESQQGGCHEG